MNQFATVFAFTVKACFFVCRIVANVFKTSAAFFVNNVFLYKPFLNKTFHLTVNGCNSHLVASCGKVSANVVYGNMLSWNGSQICNECFVMFCVVLNFLCHSSFESDSQMWSVTLFAFVCNLCHVIIVSMYDGGMG